MSPMAILEPSLSELSYHEVLPLPVEEDDRAGDGRGTELLEEEDALRNGGGTSDDIPLDEEKATDEDELPVTLGGGTGGMEDTLGRLGEEDEKGGGTGREEEELLEWGRRRSTVDEDDELL